MRTWSPAGWREPGQIPDFDEYTVVLRGALRAETRAGTIDVNAGQAFHSPYGDCADIGEAANRWSAKMQVEKEMKYGITDYIHSQNQRLRESSREIIGGSHRGRRCRSFDRFAIPMYPFDYWRISAYGWPNSVRDNWESPCERQWQKITALKYRLS